MNRRRLPEQSPPQEYDPIVEKNKSNNILDETPPELSSEDIEQLKNFKLKIKNYKHNNNNNDINNYKSGIFGNLDGDVTKNLKEVVLFVMRKLERFKSSGAQKRNLAVNILKSLFHDDDNITGLYIDSLMKEFKQVKTRITLKIWRYFVEND